MSKKKDKLTTLFGLAVALILWLTILSREKLIGIPITYPPLHALATFLKEIQEGRFAANFLGNIVLFIPIGALVPEVIGWEKIWKVTSIGVGFSFLIELIQLITSRGCFDLDDVILNGFGTVIGFGLYSAARKLFTKNNLNASGI